MIKKLLTVALLLALVQGVWGQPTITLSKTVGTAGTESIHDMIADHDGHLIALGQCDSVDRDTSCHYHGGSSDIWLVKMDAGGNILWQKCYGGSDEDDAYQIIQTADNGFLFVAKSYSDDGDVQGFPQGAWMVKVDSSGNMEWQQGLKYGIPHHFMQLSNGKYLLACSTINTSVDFPIHYGGQFTSDAWIWILNNDGTKDTSYHYGGSSDDVINDVIEMPNGERQMFGYSSSTDYDLTGVPAYGNRDGWILRTDSNGVIMWQKRWGGNALDELVSAVPLPGGGFLAAGNASSTDGILGDNHGPPDVWVIKLDSEGGKIVSYLYGGSGNQLLWNRLRIHKATNNLFIIGALSSGAGGDVPDHYGFDDFWTLAVDSNGLIKSSIVTGGSNEDDPFSSLLSDAATIGQAGLTTSLDVNVIDYHGNGDGWFIKVDGFTIVGEISNERNLISVFPNPLHEQFTITANHGEILRNAVLEIHQLNGELLLSKKINQNAESISVHGLSAGTYLYILYDKQQNKIASGKLIVQ